MPYLFLSTGADKFGDYKRYPWTVGFNPSAITEARISAKQILRTVEKPWIAVLCQNDDFGKDCLNGLTSGLGGSVAAVLRAMASYEVADPTIDSQMLTLQQSGANVLLSAATPKAASQAIRRAADIGWKPLHFIATTSTSVKSVLKPAGLDRATGVIPAACMKDATDPHWTDDPAMKAWRAFMALHARRRPGRRTYRAWLCHGIRHDICPETVRQ